MAHSWTPSLCSSLTGSDDLVHTPDCWEVCDWSEDDSDREFEQEAEWDACEWSSLQSNPNERMSGNDFSSSPLRVGLPLPSCHSTTGGSSRVRVCSPAANVSNLSTSLSKSLRKSPRTPKPKPKFDPCHAVTNEEGWQLTSVLQLQGCQFRCAIEVHGLSEYDILVGHSAFVSKTPADKRAWILEYFENNCPNTPDGRKDIKGMQFILCGRNVCQVVWQAVLSLTTTRFYDLRKSFLEGERAEKCIRVRSLSSKSLEAVAWMRSYFNRVGDKRPDKDGIYLPTCLSEKTIYNMFLEDHVTREKPVCFSQFNKLYRNYFPNVTIPKVS